MWPSSATASEGARPGRDPQNKGRGGEVREDMPHDIPHDTAHDIPQDSLNVLRRNERARVINQKFM